MTVLDHAALEQEFDRQVKNLLEKDYPDAAGLTSSRFVRIVERLRPRLREFKPLVKAEGMLPFVLVVKNETVSIENAMRKTERNGKIGTIKLFPRRATDFRPIKGLGLPDNPVYLLCDIDRGDATRNVTPEQAMSILTRERRSPLTIDEGVAIITHCPEFLKKNFCFSLLASRGSDRRVPALWISEGRPRLGWCWEGNPHTWLGSASCSQRLGS